MGRVRPSSFSLTRPQLASSPSTRLHSRSRRSHWLPKLRKRAFRRRAATRSARRPVMRSPGKSACCRMPPNRRVGASGFGGRQRSLWPGTTSGPASMSCYPTSGMATASRAGVANALPASPSGVIGGRTLGREPGGLTARRTAETPSNCVSDSVANRRAR